MSKEKIHKIKYIMDYDNYSSETICPYKHVTKKIKIFNKEHIMLSQPIPYVFSVCCQECEFFRDVDEDKEIVKCAYDEGGKK